MERQFGETVDHWAKRTVRQVAKDTRDALTTIQCSECPNHVQAGEFTEQELIADGWLLEPVVYCPRCGPDDQKGGR